MRAHAKKREKIARFRVKGRLSPVLTSILTISRWASTPPRFQFHASYWLFINRQEVKVTSFSERSHSHPGRLLMEKKGSLKVVTNFNMCEVTSEEVLNKDSPFVMTYTPVQKSSKSNPDSCTSPKQNQVNNPSRFSLFMLKFGLQCCNDFIWIKQVSAVMLFGVPIVALLMDGKDRLCLAQISSTLLKEFSYNEIHNRRVALGITCIQCTPVQLEILRRAGAMPVTSRRCGMITRREAERLCQSFLGEHSPPQVRLVLFYKI